MAWARRKESQENPMKLTRVEHEMPVETSGEKAWAVLARYADVGDFHPGILKSSAVGDRREGVGASRYCELPGKVAIHERVLEWDDGKSYKYDVYQWKNFPLKKMLVTFGVRTRPSPPSVWIFQTVEYKLSPAILTPIMKGKLSRSVRDTLLGYKHFMETGEPKADTKMLRKRYRGV